MSVPAVDTIRKLWPFQWDRPALSGGPDASAPVPDDAQKHKREERARWDFEAGAPIGSGRSVVKRLGGGEDHEVFAVWDERLFALMVAKILRPDRIEDEGSLRALRHEAQLLERLAHPSLVRGFGAVLDGPHPHVLLELVEGPTLHQLIRREGALPLGQLLPIAQHIAGVVHYLSTETVVHLDIKPSNIVMATTPRLIDLGLARTFEKAARIECQIGTDAYMPPEQCDPEAWPGRVGTAADVWGLGATLYHATGGELPFPQRSGWDNDDLQAQFPQIVNQPEPLPKHLPAPLRELIGKMLSKNPQDRPTAGYVAEAIRDLHDRQFERRRRRVDDMPA